MKTEIWLTGRDSNPHVCINSASSYQLDDPSKTWWRERDSNPYLDYKVALDDPLPYRPLLKAIRCFWNLNHGPSSVLEAHYPNYAISPKIGGYFRLRSELSGFSDLRFHQD